MAFKEKSSVFTDYTPQVSDIDKDKGNSGFNLQGDKDFMENQGSNFCSGIQNSDIKIPKSDKKNIKPASGFQ